MKYRKESEVGQNLDRALCLEKSQTIRLRNAINKAYANCTGGDFSIDEINAFVAPYIKNPEEAFFVATVVLTEIFGALQELGMTPKI